MRALVPLLIVLGLLLPRGGAALGEALGTERVVICRGDAIVVVVLGADGAPVETLIVEHAGHNWRSVDAPIEPSVEEIVTQSAEFLIRHREHDE